MSDKNTQTPPPKPTPPPPQAHDIATCPCTNCAALRAAGQPGYWDDHIAWERENPSSPGGGPG